MSDETSGDEMFWSEVRRCAEGGEMVVVARPRNPQNIHADDSERRDAVRYRVVRRMDPEMFRSVFMLATGEQRFDDLIEEQAEKLLGRTFEQELHRLASLDLAAEVCAG